MDRNGQPTRRTAYEVVIDPECARPHARQRIAVTALFAPDWASGAELLMRELEDG